MTRARVTLRELNRATLARQLLLRREPLDVVDGVRRLGVLQAQEAPSPYLALWSRLAAFDPASMDEAFSSGVVLKGTLVRITLHAVVAEDHPVFHAAMRPTLRAARLHDRRFRVAGLSIEEADTLAPEVLAAAREPRSNAEMEAWVEARLGERAHPGIWWAMRSSLPVVHAPTGGPWSFGLRPLYRDPGLPPFPGDPEAALPQLVRRYLAAFGPATPRDIAAFALVQAPRVRAALQALDGELESLDGPEGERLVDLTGAPRPDPETPAPPRLLPMWDSVVLAHADRRRLIRDAYRPLVGRANGDTLPVLLVDGEVAGVWRPLDDAIEATAFHRLPAAAWAGLEAEAASLLALLADREPSIYRRYARWWPVEPAAEVRRLGR